jgi:hypothetical protein
VKVDGILSAISFFMALSDFALAAPERKTTTTAALHIHFIDLAPVRAGCLACLMV